jgi:hypothetical protein
MAKQSLGAKPTAQPTKHLETLLAFVQKPDSRILLSLIWILFLINSAWN